jgi:CRP/FNR family transcriptional regulator, cyclic AMP receptor protein
MASASDRVKTVLRQSPSFGALSDAGLDRLAGAGRTVKFAKGDPVYRRGDPGDSMLVVLSGSVKVFNVSAEAREIVLTFLKEGAILGEIAVLDGKERTADAAALEATEGFVIHRRELRSVLETEPKALFRLLEVMCDRLRSTNAVLEGHGLQMQARAAAALLRLAEQHGQDTKTGTRVALKITQKDLGNYIGLSRENVSRLLGDFKDQGLVAMEGTAIVITDSDGLRDIAEGGVE